MSVLDNFVNSKKRESHKSSRSEILFKIEVLKKFAVLLNRDYNAGAFL